MLQQVQHDFHGERYTYQEVYEWHSDAMISNYISLDVTPHESIAHRPPRRHVGSFTLGFGDRRAETRCDQHFMSGSDTLD